MLEDALLRPRGIECSVVLDKDPQVLERLEIFIPLKQLLAVGLIDTQERLAPIEIL